MPHSSNKTSGGNSRKRRNQRRHEESADASRVPIIGTPNEKEAAPSNRKNHQNADSIQKRNELYTLIGYGLAFAAWGATALPGQWTPWLGSVLLLAAAISVLTGLWRIWTLRRIWFACCAVIMIGAVCGLDWFGIVKPERGKPFQDLLVEGYHLTNECQSVPGDTEMPTWMRDQSKAWQSRAQQLISDRLNSADAQTWQKSIVIGTADDEKMNAYQCLWLSNKVAALEKIIANKFEPKLQHRAEIKPTYWFNAVNGEFDMTKALANGDMHPRVFINGGGKAKNPSGMIKVTGHSPFNSGTVTFSLDPP